MKVVGCFVEFEDKFVILLRHSHKPDGNMWGLPSGKVEPGESARDAVLRELEEETGYKALPTEIHYAGTYEFISSRGSPYTYATFKIQLNAAYQIRIEPAAHAQYEWVTAKECYAKSNLISGFHELLKLVGYASTLKRD